MAVQLPIEAMPTYLTVKALAQRWGVDRDYVSAMIGDGTLGAFAEFSPRFKSPFGEVSHHEPPGLYKLAYSGTHGTLIDIQWTFREAFQLSPEHTKSAPDFLLPTKKKELIQLVFRFTAEQWKKTGDHDDQSTGYYEYLDLVGSISEFVIHKLDVQQIEQAVTKEEIQAGEIPKVVASRRILLTVVNALCQEAGINPRDRSATTEIMRLLDGQGTPAAERTVRDAIKQIPDAMKARKTEQ